MNSQSSFKTRPPTDYGRAVMDALATVVTGDSGKIDQRVLRHFLRLSSAHLVTDTTTSLHVSPLSGVESWSAGFSRLVDILLALHSRGELELETLNEASRACSECWTVAASWPAGDVGEQSRDKVRKLAGKLRTILDANRRTYRGGLVYVP